MTAKILGKKLQLGGVAMDIKEQIRYIESNLLAKYLDSLEDELETQEPDYEDYEIWDYKL
jgi:hypothetical protein